MACADKALLLHAYVDGELDLIRSLDVEEHLKTCAACTEELSRHRTLRSSLRSGNLYQRAPQELKDRIRAAAVGEKASAVAPVASKKGLVASTRPVQRRPTFEWLAIAAAILIAFALGSGMIPGIVPRPNLVAEEAVAAHIRSLQPGHLMDIQSTDQHTVKPWFDGKLDFAPPVHDFNDQGFPLIGGRLDYLDHRNVAALVYQRRKHLINVFVWPESSGDVANSSNLQTQRIVNGYNFLGWRNGAVHFCAVSDVSVADLHQLKELLDQ